MTVFRKPAVLGASFVLLFLAQVGPDAPLGVDFPGQVQAIVGAPLTPVSVAGVARRTAMRTTAVVATTATASAASAQSAAAQQQAATAQQQAATAQQQSATAQQQASAPQQPAATPPALPNPAPTTFSPARFDAGYLHNPRPNYPAVSRRLGEEGKVLLRVLVSPDGRAAAVNLEKSSNFERLDEAARQAVAQWRFVPAKRGDEAVEATIIIPLVFRLED